MYAPLKWLGIFTGAALLTLALFIAFSHLFTPNTALLNFDAGASGSTVVFDKKASKKEPAPTVSKTPPKYTPLHRPVPLDVCIYPFYESPEQSPLIPEIQKPNFSITLRDPPACRDRIPLAPKATPVMPNSAAKSGHCNMAFQYDAKGRYINIKPISCSEGIFANPSIKAMQQWHDWCAPEVGFDTALIRETIITYKLSDENGDIIPE